MFQNYITEKENRIVAKLKNKDGSFKKSVIIPTDYYPLNGNEFKVFHSENTERTYDEILLSRIDRINYKIGCCYSNTAEVVKLLKAAGYDVKSYVGWLFVADSQFPVHHCWAVINDKHVIDLADDFSLMLCGDNYKIFEELNTQETRTALLDFTKEVKELKNSMRCCPVGTPTPILYYIGSECEPEEGKRIYQRLIKKYPDHECQRNCNGNGLNPTQKLLADNGLMAI